ncbi:MAG: S8 family serine peptidase [Capsulimonas sp.]|uniref:S8 family serine peptidase n=1 Tax=Capsulimonas sp. TaxID=2494211 RepID=UPI003264A615
MIARSFFSLALLMTVTAAHGAPKLRIPYPNMDGGILKVTTRGGAGSAKMAPELRLLARQFDARPAGADTFVYSKAQLKSRFGIDGTERTPQVSVALTVASSAGDAPLEAAGAVIYKRSVSHTVYAHIPVARLADLAAESSVYAIRLARSAAYPPTPRSSSPPRIRPFQNTRGSETTPTDFDHQGLTGKGIVVGVIDSGIDWRHADFRRADGSTRILALWDMTDQSWKTSKGKIGSKPPQVAGKEILGTLYTRDQIDAALRKAGVVKSLDSEGHGTACAGTAAGSGADFPGVAPEADLIVVKAGNNGANPFYFLGTQFVVDQAKLLGEPCVISQSFGSNDTAHDGGSLEEEAMNEIAAPGNPGVCICVAAGNDGQNSSHASGRFGAQTPGQADIESRPIQLFVQQPTLLDAYFKDADEWGLAVVGLDKFLIGKNGEPAVFYVARNGKGIKGIISTPTKIPKSFSAFFQTVQTDQVSDGKEDRVSVPLQTGRYLVYAFGAGAKVTDGAFHLYLPFSGNASFGDGADKHAMVASPGTASNVITVGSYNVRKSWRGASGKTTTYNLPVGDISDYSSPGFRRDGIVKPEIAAPGAYTISPLAQGSSMGLNEAGKPDLASLTPDKKHIAWSGTSAACPYTAGVIALMLQKNPALDEAQIRKILTSTAHSDDFTGSVPNSEWGYGKLDPAAAIHATLESDHTKPEPIQP